MARGAKIAGYAVGGCVAWLVILLAVGVCYGGRAGERVQGRIADSLLAQVTLERSDLALVRGRLELGGLKVTKDDLGKLAIEVGDVRCELPPLGLALVDHECRDLVIDELRLEATTAAVFQLDKPKRAPLRVRHVEIHDATLVFSPSAFVPDLGRIEIKVEHVVAGPTVFKTPLSWMFAMQELRASFDLPAGIVVHLEYKGGMLTATGSIFGAKPVTLPVTLPVAEAADDAKAEIGKLVRMGRDLAQQIVEKRAKDWLKSKLSL